MAANGRGTMRPQSRSPPFLVIGLLVALVVLGANYWSLSSNNNSLSMEIGELQDQVRQLSSKRISAEKKIDSISETYNTFKENLAQREQDLKTIKTSLKEKEDQIVKLTKEKDQCDGAVKNCEENSNGIQQELQKKKEELEALKKADSEKTQDTSKCDSVCAEGKKMLLSALEKTSGLNVIAALQQAGIDIGDFKAKVAQAGIIPNQQAGQQPQAGQQQPQAGQQQPQAGQQQPQAGQQQPLAGQQQPQAGQQQPQGGQQQPQAGQQQPQAGQQLGQDQPQKSTDSPTGQDKGQTGVDKKEEKATDSDKLGSNLNKEPSKDLKTGDQDKGEEKKQIAAPGQNAPGKL